MQSMLFDKLKSAAVVFSGLSLLGFGALVAGQQVTDKRAQDRPHDTAIANTNDSPDTLKLVGSTDYDPATVTVVRTPFDGRVDKVLVDLGLTVKSGDPLLELFSVDLAEAKSNYEAATVQWLRDKKVLDYKTPLAAANTVPRTELIEVESDEAQSRLKMKLAKDKLLVYGLTEKEIENAKNENGVQKAKMILRSRTNGVMVLRSVVSGNYYTSADSLMTIATLDHLWVRGSVSELDAENVKVGQKLKVIFPPSNRTIDAVVNYIDNAIDAESQSAKFRTTIPNPEGRFKAGMFVRVILETGASRDTRNEPQRKGTPPECDCERQVDRARTEGRSTARRKRGTVGACEDSRAARCCGAQAGSALGWRNESQP